MFDLNAGAQYQAQLHWTQVHLLPGVRVCHGSQDLNFLRTIFKRFQQEPPPLSYVLPSPDSCGLAGAARYIFRRPGAFMSAAFWNQHMEA